MSGGEGESYIRSVHGRRDFFYTFISIGLASINRERPERVEKIYIKKTCVRLGYMRKNGQQRAL